MKDELRRPMMSLVKAQKQHKHYQPGSAQLKENYKLSRVLEAFLQENIIFTNS